ncbi:MAG: hypothetical protein Kow0029_31890 [Candidatus Rifleibacteriota bacterium]
MRYERRQEGIFSIFKSDIFWLILIFIGLLGCIDYYWIAKYKMLALETRSLICLLILLLASLKIDEAFIFWSIALLFPNAAFVFYLSVKIGKIKIFGWAILTQTIVVLIGALYQYRLSRSFMPEESFRKMKAELKDHRDNSLARILYFSLIGCLRDKNKVISQAYHILDNFFKAEKALVFLADYEKNQLVPVKAKGDVRRIDIQPIMVSPTFWTSAAYDPEKGMLNVINGQTVLPSLRKLIPQANIETLAAMPLASGKRLQVLFA